MALHAKIESDEAEDDGCGGFTFKDDNEM
jgi:hypothetical protein